MTPALSLLAALAAATPEASVEAPAQQGVTVYPAAFFAGMNATTALDMVKRLPGFALDTGATVRGFEGAAGNVLVDGARPVSKTDGLDQVLYRMPASQVERIELIRGGAPGIDMQGKAILANVIRRKGGGLQGLVAVANNYSPNDGRQRPGGRVEGSGQLGPGRAEASLRFGQYFDDGSGDGAHSQIGPTRLPLEASRVNGRGDGWQWETNDAYEMPLADGKLRVNGRGFWDHYRYREVNHFSQPAGETDSEVDHQNHTQTEFGGRWARSLGARTQLELVGLRQTDDTTYVADIGDPSGASRYDQQKNIVESIGRVVLKHRLTPALSLEAGGEYAVNTLDGLTGFSQNGTLIALPAANVTVEEDRAEGFAKAVWRPTPQWTLEGSLRYESSSISSAGDVVLAKDLSFAKPRLFITWAPWDGIQIRARYEREVGQLNFDDFVATSSPNTGVTTGNPNLNPQQDWVGELAVEQSFWRNGSAALTVRHLALTDAVDRAPVFSKAGVFDAPANIGDGTQDELQFDLTLPMDALGVKGGQLHGTSTWRRSEVTDPTTGARREISGLKPFVWEAHFTQDLPKLDAVWGIDVFSGYRQTYYRFNEIATNKQNDAWVSVFAEWKPRPDTVLRVELDNVLERGFEYDRLDFTGPRGVSLVRSDDNRDLNFGREIYMRLRKSFG